jgi:hypothetical protein
VILLFNLTTLESETNGSAQYLVEALRKFSLGRKIPKNQGEKNKPIAKLTRGSSFIVDHEGLFSNKCDVEYKAQFIKLAGRRDITLYKLKGITYLDLSMFPDINIEAIKHNPLIYISNNKIHFKY